MTIGVPLDMTGQLRQWADAATDDVDDDGDDGDDARAVACRMTLTACRCVRGISCSKSALMHRLTCKFKHRRRRNTMQHRAWRSRPYQRQRGPSVPELFETLRVCRNGLIQIDQMLRGDQSIGKWKLSTKSIPPAPQTAEGLETSGSNPP